MRASGDGSESSFSISASFALATEDGDLPIIDWREREAATREVTIESEDGSSSSEVALVLLIVLIALAVAAVIIICIYNKRKFHD